MLTLNVGGTTFVATVDAGALAIVVPLLFRGFLERATAAKRMSAVIASTMVNLVEDPADAVPFLLELLPALTKAADEVSDPEARDVCAKAKQQLERIRTAANLSPSAITAATIKSTLNRVVPEDSVDLGLGALGLSVSSDSARTLAIDAASSIVNIMVKSKCYDAAAWAKAVAPALQTVLSAAKALAITAQLLADADAEGRFATIEPSAAGGFEITSLEAAGTARLHLHVGDRIMTIGSVDITSGWSADDVRELLRGPAGSPISMVGLQPPPPSPPPEILHLHHLHTAIVNAVCSGCSAWPHQQSDF
jgi:hypothetical protein